jgi:hypothetical protein
MDKSRAGILSLTIARQKKDVTVGEFATLSDLLTRLHEDGVITDGAGASEKGERMNHLHLQCMLWLPSMNLDARDVQTAMSEPVYGHTDIPRHSNWHVYAEVHWPEEEANVSWKTMVGCVLLHPCDCKCL